MQTQFQRHSKKPEPHQIIECSRNAAPTLPQKWDDMSAAHGAQWSHFSLIPMKDNRDYVRTEQLFGLCGGVRALRALLPYQDCKHVQNQLKWTINTDIDLSCLQLTQCLISLKYVTWPQRSVVLHGLWHAGQEAHTGLVWCYSCRSCPPHIRHKQNKAPQEDIILNKTLLCQNIFRDSITSRTISNIGRKIIYLLSDEHTYVYTHTHTQKDCWKLLGIVSGHSALLIIDGGPGELLCFWNV